MNKCITTVVIGTVVVGGIYLVNKHYGKKIQALVQGMVTKAEPKAPLRLTHQEDTK